MTVMHDKCKTLQVICGWLECRHKTLLHYFCMPNASHTLEHQEAGNSTQLATGWNFFVS